MQVVFVSGCVDDDIVDVNNYVANAIQDFLHEPLKGGRATQESHRRSNLFKLTVALSRERRKVAVLIVDGHLPEPGSKINHGKNG